MLSAPRSRLPVPTSCCQLRVELGSLKLSIGSTAGVAGLFPAERRVAMARNILRGRPQSTRSRRNKASTHWEGRTSCPRTLNPASSRLRAIGAPIAEDGSFSCGESASPRSCDLHVCQDCGSADRCRPADTNQCPGTGNLQYPASWIGRASARTFLLAGMHSDPRTAMLTSWFFELRYALPNR